MPSLSYRALADLQNLAEGIRTVLFRTVRNHPALSVQDEKGITRLVVSYFPRGKHYRIYILKQGTYVDYPTPKEVVEYLQGATDVEKKRAL